MIGESGVGKSTLIGRLCEDRFMPEHRQYTLGKSFEMVYMYCTCIHVLYMIEDDDHYV